QRRSGQLPVGAHRMGVHALRGPRALPVAQLPDVEVARVTRQALGPYPSEEDVARGLHQPLALDHPLTLIRDMTLADEGSEHRVLGLLGLEEERIGLVATEHEDDP